MNVIEPRMVPLDLESIVDHASVVAEVVGVKWLRRKRQQLKERSYPKKLHEFGPIYQPPIHPIVDWMTDYSEKWWPELRRTRVPGLSPAVIKLALLGQALDLTRSQEGFGRLIPRLKQFESFEATAFEAAVAAGYVSVGYAVEFVEEGAERSPDLRVTMQDGRVFYVECKCREPGSERDRRIESIWTRLETSLISNLRPQRLNYLVVINARVDPEWEDVDYLEGLVQKACEAGSFSSGPYRAVAERTGRFEILVQKLANPDEPIEANQMEVLSTERLDQGIMASERMITEEGKSYIRNPIFLGFRTQIPPDWISGIVNLLDSARSQLPEQGPGVVWIRIPDVSWKEGLIEPLERVEELLRPRLRGQYNRRINAAFVMKRVFEHSELNGIAGLVWHPLIIRIDHDNPISPLGDSNSDD